MTSRNETGRLPEDLRPVLRYPGECESNQGANLVSDDKELVPIICGKCGDQTKRELGWLRARAGLTDLLCANPRCREPAHYTTEELERVALEQRAGGFRKLRIN